MNIGLKLDNQKSLLENTWLEKEVLRCCWWGGTVTIIVQNGMEIARESTDGTPCNPAVPLMGMDFEGGEVTTSGRGLYTHM